MQLTELICWLTWPDIYHDIARTGGRDLTSSAAYPIDFGNTIARLHSEAMVTEHAYVRML